MAATTTKTPEPVAENAPTVETTFTTKAGDVITIQRYGVDDYDATWDDTFSVRGTLLQVMQELKKEIPDLKE